MRELLARVKALLRRGESAAPLVAAPLIIDPARHQATWEGRPLILKLRVFDLLLFLARNRDVVLSRDVLLARVWGYDRPVDTRTVDVHIRWLREKIEARPGAPAHLTTVRDLGYRFTCPA